MKTKSSTKREGKLETPTTYIEAMSSNIIRTHPQYNLPNAHMKTKFYPNLNMLQGAILHFHWKV